MSFPVSPWHLWGQKQVLQPVVTGSATSRIPAASNQLVKVAYGRPDTWSFMFESTVLDAPDTGGGTLTIGVSFDLIIGVGRSSMKLPAFGGFRFEYTGVKANIIGRQKWTSVVQAPLNDDDPSNVFRPSLEHIVAEDIQCSGSAIAIIDSGPAIGQKVTVEVQAFFAPRTHIRPEWFTDSRGDETRFRGHENGGS